LIPIILIIALIPLIVRLKVIPLTGASYMFWNGERKNMDMFSYYKSIWIIIFTILLLLIFTLKMFKEKRNAIKKTMIYIPTILYLIFVILSTIFSKYKSIALMGYVDRYEGMYVLIAYIIILVITINIVNSKDDIVIVLIGLFISATIIGIIAIFQYIGHDIWATTLGQKAIIPSKLLSLSDFKFNSVKNKIYSTLYHYDYVGSYMAIIFPLTFSLALLIKKRNLKLIIGVISILMLIVLVGCGSRAGIVGTAIALILLLVMLNKYIIKNYKHFITLVVILISIFVLVNKLSNDQIKNRIYSLNEQIQTLIGFNSKEINSSYDKLPIQDIKIVAGEAVIKMENETLKIKFNNGKLYFLDQDDNYINMNINIEKHSITLEDKRYKDFAFIVAQLNENRIVLLKKGNIKLYFVLTEKGIMFSNNRGQIINFKPIEHLGFEGKEKLGSARGYIWSRSIPLLKDTILIGHGPDTFAIYFPQYDYIGKLKAYGTTEMLVDKPHNFYLQVGINTGVISLLALLVLFGMYIISSLRLYFRNSYDNFYSIVGVSIFVAIIGYLGAAFFNDSVVSVAPVFWVLLGIGISINMNMKSNILKNKY